MEFKIEMGLCETFAYLFSLRLGLFFDVLSHLHSAQPQSLQMCEADLRAWARWAASQREPAVAAMFDTGCKHSSALDVLWGVSGMALSSQSCGFLKNTVTGLCCTYQSLALSLYVRNGDFVIGFLGFFTYLYIFNSLYYNIQYCYYIEIWLFLI